MFEPIETERLVVRGAQIGDVDALHRRRNHPDAARYQDWELPFPLEAARTLVVGAASSAHPTVGDWWMATIVERASESIVGDIAFRLESIGRAATMGYTLHPDHWGRGYATEAVGAMIDRLIDTGVRRVSASIDPENVASARLLERLGFRYEGKLAGSWFESPGPDAPAGDDILFGLTAEARAAWLGRPTGRPAEVRLTPIDRGNYRTVEKLETHWSQRNLVAPVAGSYADALFAPMEDGRRAEPWLRAIEADEGDGHGPRPVGFVMMGIPPTADVAEDDEPYLWRLLIDRAHQGRGIGTLALDRIEDDLRRAGHRAIWVHWVDGVPGSPSGFYRRRGYEPSGRVEDGETEGCKILRA